MSVVSATQIQAQKMVAHKVALMMIKQRQHLIQLHPPWLLTITEVSLSPALHCMMLVPLIVLPMCLIITAHNIVNLNALKISREQYSACMHVSACRHEDSHQGVKVTRSSLRSQCAKARDCRVAHFASDHCNPDDIQTASKCR